MKPSTKIHLSISILTLYLATLCSCSDNTSSGKLIIDIKSMIGKGAIYNASQFIKEIKYIPLETGSDSMVGEIENIVIANNQIYVLHNNRISIFDITGRYLNSLNRMGRGPQEYTRILDYAVDTKGSIFILVEMNAIIEYNNNLAFVRKVDLRNNPNDLCWDIQFLKEGLFVSSVYHYDEPKYQSLTIFNSEFEIVNSYNTEIVPITPTFVSIMPYFCYIYEGDMAIYRRVCDTIFNINIENNYSKSVKYTLDYGEYAFTEDIVKNKKEEECRAISLIGLLEVDNYLFMIFDFHKMAPERFDDVVMNKFSNFFENTLVYAIYDKREGRLALLNQPEPQTLGLKDDLTGWKPFWPMFITENEELVNSYNALDLMPLVEEGKIPSLANLKEDDNPVIVIATLK